MRNLLKLAIGLLLVNCLILFDSCKKEIQKESAVQEEFSTVTSNQTHGHLKQTKTYTAEVALKWIDLQWRVFPTQQEEDSGLGFFPYRFYAYCGIALYESVMPGMPAYQSLSGQLTNMPLMMKTETGMAYHWPTCANAALASMTKKLIPNISIAKKSSIDSLEGALNATYQSELSVAIFQRSVEFGKHIAEGVYAWSRTDGFFAEYPNYVLPVGIGLWQPTPPGFLLPGKNAYSQHLRLLIPGLRPENILPPPISYSTDQSSAFFNRMKEVYDTSLILSAQQIAQANYWRGIPPNGGVPAQWFNILRKLLIEKGTTVMLDEAALAYCRMGIALNDAAISSFKEMFLYNRLRPITYIRNVMGHVTWNSLFPATPYPGYPDFHSTIAGSSGAVLNFIFGSNYHFNTDGTNPSSFSGYSFNSFNDAVNHAALSRFYAGVSSKPSVEAGILLGNKTAQYLETKIKFLKD